MRRSLKKIHFTLLLALLLLLQINQPCFAFGKSSLTDIRFRKTFDSKLEIMLESDKPFEYSFFYKENKLYIALKEATIAQNLVMRLQQVRKFPAHIEKLDINQEDGSAQVVLTIDNPKSFKFVVNAPKGKFVESVPLLKKDIGKSELSLKSEKDTSLIDETLLLSFVEDDRSQKINVNRLSLEQIKPNNLVGNDKPTLKKPLDMDDVDKQPLSTVSMKPLSSHELIERLTSSDVEIPRLVQNAESETAQKQYGGETEEALWQRLTREAKNIDNKQSSEVKKEETSSVESIDDEKEVLSLLQQGLRTKPLDSGSKKETSSSVKKDKLFTIKELLPFEIDINEADFVKAEPIKLPSPKPSLNSDGSMGVTIISSGGVRHGEVKLKSSQAISLPRGFDNSYEIYEKIQGVSSSASIKDFKSTENAYLAIIKEHLDSPWPYIAIAQFYEQNEKFSDAVNSYQKALSFLPRKPEIVYNLSIDSYHAGRLDDAIGYLNDLLSMSPGFPLAYYAMGVMYYEKGKYDIAVQNLGEAISLNPYLSNGYYMLGLVCMKGQNMNASLKYLAQCLQLDPENKDCKDMITYIKKKQASSND